MAVVYNNNQNNQETQGNNTPVNTGASAPTTGASPAQPQQQAQAKPQGSGRFTNLQKYLNVNQGAGEALGQKISQDVNKNLGQKKEQTQNYYSQLGDAVNQAKQAAQAGTGYTNQLRQIGQNIKNADTTIANRGQDLGVSAFRESPNYQNFQDVQSGRAINEQLLNLRNQQTNQAAQDYSQAARQAAQNVATEQGRFNLLKNSLGGNTNPAYSMGQQKLDSLFLSKGGLGNLRQQVGQDVKNAANIQRQNQIAASDINSLQGQEQNIIKDINSQAQQNTQDYSRMLENYIPQVNQQREADWQSLVSNLGNRQLTQQQANALGLNLNDPSGLRTYNVMNNLSAQDIANRAPDAANVKDIVLNNEINRYNTLADIAGVQAPNRQFEGVTENPNALTGYTSKEGEASLNSRIKAAENLFNQTASGTNLNHRIEDQLQQAYYGPNGITANPYSSGGIGGIHQNQQVSWDQNPWSFGGAASGNAADLLNRGQAGIGSTRIGAMTGNDTDWGRSEQQWAAGNVWQQFQDFLQNQGYNNRLNIIDPAKGK